jgi:hypothetical protein
MTTITTFDQLNQEFQSLSGKRWLFRGQAGVWPLTPSLERSIAKFGKNFEDIRKWETRLLREFRRHFHRYSAYRPNIEDTLEWLTFMQHYGAPTRLLDWTYSPHVALFFAVEYMDLREDKACEIWAVDNMSLDAQTRVRLSPELQRLYDDKEHDKDRCAELLGKMLAANDDHIVALNPFNLSERLAVQQGVFLLSQSTKLSFTEVFETMRSTTPTAFRQFRIEFSQKFRDDAYTSLHKMNMTAVSLFPGLDGFSRSFANLLLHPTLWAFQP